MTLVVHTPLANQAERNYVLDVVLAGWFGQTYRCVPSERDNSTITLQGQPGELVIDETLLLGDLKQARDHEVHDRSAWSPIDGLKTTSVSVEIPVLYGPVPASAVEVSAGSTRICLDLLGTIFSVLTGLEDRWILERDRHGRIPASASLIFKRELTAHPVVDELSELLWSGMLSVWPGLKRPEMQTTIRPTHDVDRLGKFGAGGAVDVAIASVAGLRRGGLSESARTAAQGVSVMTGRRPDPYFTFDRLMTLAEDRGISSSFYFISQFDQADGTRMSRYQMSDPRVRQLLREITARGHTIGLHAGYDAFRNAERLQSDLAALKSAMESEDLPASEIGGRHHYLRWDTQRSPRCWADAGLAHDSSIGYDVVPGFRLGTSRKFRLWDHQTGSATDVVERPLIWMDSTIPTYLGLEFGAPETFELMSKLKSRCRLFGGDFTFVVHNDVFASPGAEQFMAEMLA